MEEETKTNTKNKFIDQIKKNFFILSIALALIVGFLIGFLIKNSSYKNSELELWVKLPGTIFIRSLELLILPVIFIGVVAACSSISPEKNLKITLFSLCFIMGSHLITTIIGTIGSLILISFIDLKTSQISKSSTILKPQKQTFDIISDILRNIIPKNIIKASTHQEITVYSLSTSNSSVYTRSVQYIDGTNLLGILFFAILLGLATSILADEASFFKTFFSTANKVLVLILKWLITLFPIGLASLIASTILEIEDISESFRQIGLFTLICVLSILFYCFIILPLVIMVFTRKNPIKYYWHFLEPMLLAFASTSGAVCIHKGIDICENKLKMNQLFARFILPFYTTLKSDGSAIFITISCCFLAHQSGHVMSLSDYSVVIIETSILCLCLPSVPSSSIVTILVILNTINVQYANIGILYTVEWLLDRIRTATNVYSHCFFSYITYEWFKKDFEDDKDTDSNQIDNNSIVIEEDDEDQV